MVQNRARDLDKVGEAAIGEHDTVNRRSHTNATGKSGGRMDAAGKGRKNESTFADIRLKSSSTFVF